VLRLLVDEVFVLRDKRTVFVGTAEATGRLSFPVICQLFVNREAVQTIAVCGEEIPRKLTKGDRRRVFFTLDSLCVPQSALRGAKVELVSAADSPSV